VFASMVNVSGSYILIKVEESASLNIFSLNSTMATRRRPSIFKQTWKTQRNKSGKRAHSERLQKHVRLLEGYLVSLGRCITIQLKMHSFMLKRVICASPTGALCRLTAFKTFTRVTERLFLDHVLQRERQEASGGSGLDGHEAEAKYPRYSTTAVTWRNHIIATRRPRLEPMI